MTINLVVLDYTFCNLCTYINVFFKFNQVSKICELHRWILYKDTQYDSSQYSDFGILTTVYTTVTVGPSYLLADIQCFPLWHLQFHPANYNVTTGQKLLCSVQFQLHLKGLWFKSTLVPKCHALMLSHWFLSTSKIVGYIVPCFTDKHPQIYGVKVT
jgi:hypothetical protein